jgi:hypothetical protein
MNTKTTRAYALAGALALGLNAAQAQTDSALLDALVKKGVLSGREAADIRASEEKDASVPAASKLIISDYIKSLKLYGDVRFRYEYLDENPQSGTALTGAGVPAAPAVQRSHDNVLERYRYRLRVGLDAVFTDNFQGGFELESNTANDSANQSFGNGFGKFGAEIGLVYLQWKPTDWLTLVGGKQRNPLYTTDLTWDPDINPEGGAELASWTFPLGGGGEAPMHDSKDMKDMKMMAPAPADEMSITVGFTAAQLIYADNQEYNTPASTETATSAVGTAGPAGIADRTDVWQFVEQIPVQFNFNKSTFIKVAPGFDSYTNGGNSGIPGSFTNGTTGSVSWTGGNVLGFYGPGAADDLEIFQAPGEFDFKAANIPFKVYWDFDLNTDGKSRVQDILLGADNPKVTTTVGGLTAGAAATNRATLAQNRDLGDNVAWLAGVQVGVNKKKGDWSIRSDFRQIGLGAIDPNENDSDWGDSFLNQQGIKVSSTYNFTDFLTGTVTFYDTWNYKSALLDGTAGQLPGTLPLTGNGAASNGYATGSSTAAAPGTGLGSLVGENATERVDVDLQWKF